MTTKSFETFYEVINRGPDETTWKAWDTYLTLGEARDLVDYFSGHPEHVDVQFQIVEVTRTETTTSKVIPYESHRSNS